jgi:hypothetical protein
MMRFNPRCVDCEQTRFVNLQEVYASDPPGIDKASNEAWELRRQRIPELAGTCDCGGRFAEDAPIRCLACRSTAVASLRPGLMID